MFKIVNISDLLGEVGRKSLICFKGQIWINTKLKYFNSDQKVKCGLISLKKAKIRRLLVKKQRLGNFSC